MKLKKDMLIKKEDGDLKLFRILAFREEKVLVTDCIRKTMPVWINVGQLQGFVEEEEELPKQNIDALEEYSPDVRKTIYQRYNIISAVLPFVDNEAMRSELISKMAEEHKIRKQTVRKYLCGYLATKDIRSLAPQERDTERALTKDEKNMRKALNRYYYTTKKRTLKSVYTLMLNDSCCGYSSAYD